MILIIYQIRIQILLIKYLLTYLKKEALNKIVKYYLENSQEGITIDTLDGSKVSWYNQMWILDKGLICPGSDP
jgi:hypothetical protein